MPSRWIASIFAIALTGCPAEPTGVVVVVDAQPWLRDNAAALEVVVLDAEGEQRGHEVFALTGEDASPLPVRIWVRSRAEESTQRFVIAATLLDAAGAPLVATVATAEAGPELRTGLLCIEDGCLLVECSAADACVGDPAGCERCTGRACAPAELVYAGPFECPAAEASETACFDMRDADGDGRSDCADEDCEGAPCDPYGSLCTSGACTCALDAPETSCGDGINDDCDPAGADCADEDCDGQPCGAHGRVCVSGACACPSGDTVEILCMDGTDDDCDGLTDCEDIDCHVPVAETVCGDGHDNDCNGATDCMDPACDRRSCGARHVCCGTTCTDIGRARSCGACTIQCGFNEAADRLFYCDLNDRIGMVGWGCGCDRDRDCPSGQYCVESLNRCSCDNDGVGCEDGQECSRRDGDWDFCYYPQPP